MSCTRRIGSILQVFPPGSTMGSIRIVMEPMDDVPSLATSALRGTGRTGVHDQLQTDLPRWLKIFWIAGQPSKRPCHFSSSGRGGRRIQIGRAGVPVGVVKGGL